MEIGEVIDMRTRSAESAAAILGVAPGAVVKSGAGRVSFVSRGNVLTSEARDRYGDVVRARGGDFSQFLRNPGPRHGILQLSHGFTSAPHPAIGRVTNLTVGKSESGLSAVLGDFEFHSSALAVEIAELFQGRFLRAGSIGFQPKGAGTVRVIGPTGEPVPNVEPVDFAYGGAPDGYGFEFLAWTMLEHSVVPVPANPEALGRMRSMPETARVLGLQHRRQFAGPFFGKATFHKAACPGGHCPGCISAGAADDVESPDLPDIKLPGETPRPEDQMDRAAMKPSDERDPEEEADTTSGRREPPKAEKVDDDDEESDDDDEKDGDKKLPPWLKGKGKKGCADEPGSEDDEDDEEEMEPAKAAPSTPRPVAVFARGLKESSLEKCPECAAEVLYHRPSAEFLRHPSATNKAVACRGVVLPTRPSGPSAKDVLRIGRVLRAELKEKAACARGDIQSILDAAETATLETTAQPEATSAKAAAAPRTTPDVRAVRATTTDEQTTLSPELLAAVARAILD